MIEQKRVPQLRFEEFNNKSIIEEKFNDIFLFSTGKNIKQKEASPEFSTPCVRYGELYHMYNEVINEVINRTNIDKTELLFSNGDEVLLPSAGEDPLDIGSASALLVKDVAIGRTINILKPKIENVYSQKFVAYYINEKLKKKISTLAKGSSISNVYNSDLKRLRIFLPILKEQKKIASFLSSVDKKTEQLQEKKTLLEEYKKGVMQQIFSQQLRFTDKDGNTHPDWEEKNLQNLCKINKGSQLNSEYLTKEGLYPCINGGINPSGFTENYNREGFTITISEGGNSCGFVNFIKTKFWCGGHCYSLDILEAIIDNTFLYQLLKHNQKQIMRLRVGSGLPNIQKKDIQKLKLKFPSIEEQTQIANFLSAIDKKIELVNTQIENTQVFKKGLLQQMFV